MAQTGSLRSVRLRFRHFWAICLTGLIGSTVISPFSYAVDPEEVEKDNCCLETSKCVFNSAICPAITLRGIVSKKHRTPGNPKEKLSKARQIGTCLVSCCCVVPSACVGAALACPCCSTGMMIDQCCPQCQNQQEDSRGPAPQRMESTSSVNAVANTDTPPTQLENGDQPDLEVCEECSNPQTECVSAERPNPNHLESTPPQLPEL